MYHHYRLPYRRGIACSETRDETSASRGDKIGADTRPDAVVERIRGVAYQRGALYFIDSADETARSYEERTGAHPACVWHVLTLSWTRAAERCGENPCGLITIVIIDNKLLVSRRKRR